MKHKSPIELLINIVSDVIEISKNNKLTAKELKKILFTADFPPSEAIQMIEWFQNFANTKNKQNDFISKSKSIRLFTTEEINKISFKNLNKLNKMFLLNLISSYERELVINQAMQIKEDELTEDNFNWICKMVFANQQESNLKNNKQNKEQNEIINFILKKDSDKIVSH